MKERSSLIIALVLILFLLPLTVACKATSEATLPARYGPDAKNLALRFVNQFPQRYSGSKQEKAAGDYLAKELASYGYEVEKASFNFSDASGAAKTASNIIAKKKGTGFKADGKVDEQNKHLVVAPKERWTLVISAHYDSPIALDLSPEMREKYPKSPALANYNGIHDNGAAVATILLFAKKFKDLSVGYDVEIAFLAASSDNYAGAKAYFESFSPEKLQSINAFYNLDSVYAGDKVYVHAGQNSALSLEHKNYNLRRKMYEATDVYYENRLWTNNNFVLYTNQSSAKVKLKEEGPELVYREWSLKQSDHSIFDQAMVPIVFFDSYNYDESDLAKIKQETQDPSFTATNGIIKASVFDNANYLLAHFNLLSKPEELFKTEATSETSKPSEESKKTKRPIADISRLEQRINNLAFILIECVQKPPYGNSFK